MSIDELWSKLSNATNCSSLLKKHLSEPVYKKLKTLTTSYGGTLADCINSGCQNTDSGVGIYASDPEAYDVFADVFGPIIKDYHKVDKIAHPCPNWGDLRNLGFSDLDPEGNTIVSTRVRIARSHEGYGFPPTCTKEDRQDMEALAVEALNSLRGDLKGTYYPLVGMTQETQKKLMKKHFLFNDSDRFLKDAGGYEDWPVGRGIFFNKDKTFLVWVNEEDHLRLISMQKGGDLGEVYCRLARAETKLGKRLSFAYHPNMGYLTFCPTNLGTTLRASVHIKIPKVSTLPTFKGICESLNLQARGIHGEHTASKGGVFDISNKRRLGLTEIEAVQEMRRGVEELIKMERDLQASCCPTNAAEPNDKAKVATPKKTEASPAPCPPKEAVGDNKISDKKESEVGRLFTWKKTDPKPCPCTPTEAKGFSLSKEKENDLLSSITSKNSEKCPCVPKESQGYTLSKEKESNLMKSVSSKKSEANPCPCTSPETKGLTLSKEKERDLVKSVSSKKSEANPCPCTAPGTKGLVLSKEKERDLAKSMSSKTENNPCPCTSPRTKGYKLSKEKENALIKSVSSKATDKPCPCTPTESKGLKLSKEKENDLVKSVSSKSADKPCPCNSTETKGLVLSKEKENDLVIFVTSKKADSKPCPCTSPNTTGFRLSKERENDLKQLTTSPKPCQCPPGEATGGSLQPRKKTDPKPVLCIVPETKGQNSSGIVKRDEVMCQTPEVSEELVSKNSKKDISKYLIPAFQSTCIFICYLSIVKAI